MSYKMKPGAEEQARPEAIVAYWNDRAQTYSNSVCHELYTPKAEAWGASLRESLKRMDKPFDQIRVLDLGCGPGFFSILFSRMGCKVTAVDSSPEMLMQARNNMLHEGISSVEFIQADFSKLPFADETFDVIAGRNVTWLLRDPLATYQDWYRVLIPRGKLLMYDANWYRYLDNAGINEMRKADQANRDTLGWAEEERSTPDQDKRCERIAEGLPLSYVDRPAWDVDALYSYNFRQVDTFEDAYKTLWDEGEKAYYSSSPLFKIEATK